MGDSCPRVDEQVVVDADLRVHAFACGIIGGLRLKDLARYGMEVLHDGSDAVVVMRSDSGESVTVLYRDRLAVGVYASAVSGPLIA
jgi:hypothetical protein